MVGINRNVRKNSLKRHQKSSFWELTLTVCGGKEPQTHSTNRLYFKLWLPFFKNVKELGETLICELTKNTKTQKSSLGDIPHYDRAGHIFSLALSSVLDVTK